MKLRNHWKRDLVLSFVVAFIISLTNWLLLPDYFIVSIPLFLALSSFSLLFIISIEDLKKDGMKKVSVIQIIVSIDVVILIESALIAFVRTERDWLTKLTVSSTIFSFIFFLALIFAWRNVEESNKSIQRSR